MITMFKKANTSSSHVYSFMVSMAAMCLLLSGQAMAQMFLPSSQAKDLPLHAAEAGDTEKLRQLLKDNADPNATNKDDGTALHAAA